MGEYLDLTLLCITKEEEAAKPAHSGTSSPNLRTIELESEVCPRPHFP